VKRLTTIRCNWQLHEDSANRGVRVVLDTLLKWVKSHWKLSCLCLIIIAAAVYVGNSISTPQPDPSTVCYLTAPRTGEQLQPCSMRDDQLFAMLKAHDPLIRRLVFDDGRVTIFTSDDRRIPVYLTGDSETAQLRQLAMDAQNSGANLTWETQVPPPPPMGMSAILRYGMPVFMSLGVVIIAILPIFFMMRSQMPRMGLGKRAISQKRNREKVTFADVAGQEEAKGKLRRIVNYLQDPKQFCRMGGRVPKGVLLVGGPGNGKTLLARAIAGEANVPFFPISGSDFVEMFVGVGASRVRELFDQGKKQPCIIFIDEIDAVGRKRQGANHGGGGNDERENTLNALLVEMDGFATDSGIVLIAATNRPDVLDTALTRSGRFDERVEVLNPNVKAREQLIRHALDTTVPSKDMIAEDVNPRAIAQGCAGLSGADLANMVNKAINLATEEAAHKIALRHFEHAKHELLLGVERKSAILTEKEKRIVSYHEGGHALAILYLEADGVAPLQMVTSIPRGPGLGVTVSQPLEDVYLMSRKKSRADMAMILAGRAAEQLLWGDPEEVTSGASNDIKVATNIASQFVKQFGFGGEKLGLVNYSDDDSPAPLQRSEECLREIESQIVQSVNQAYDRVMCLLKDHEAEWRAVSEALIVDETLNREQVLALCIGANPKAKELLK
jgi:cell division protease FtsH